MLPFGLLFRDINKNEMLNEDKEFIKSRLKDSAFTSFWSYNYNNEIKTKVSDLTKESFQTLLELATLDFFHF